MIIPWTEVCFYLIHYAKTLIITEMFTKKSKIPSSFSSEKMNRALAGSLNEKLLSVKYLRKLVANYF